ncbi:MAG TPA: hypothetical protein VN838_05425 [Bradyrhizobium sp.]|nr:hypothetical protein [Bradyrhizobium sp.]
MSLLDEPDGGVSSEEATKLRILRTITSKPKRDHIDELALALLQDPDLAWHAPVSHEQPKRIIRGGRQKSGSLWRGLRRLAAMLHPIRQI